MRHLKKKKKNRHIVVQSIQSKNRNGIKIRLLREDFRNIANIAMKNEEFHLVLFLGYFHTV